MMYVAILAVLVLIVLLRLGRVAAKSGNGGNWTFKIDTVPTVLTTAIDAMGNPGKVVFNGQEYSSPDEMPPDARAAYDLAMGSMRSSAGKDGFSGFLGAGGGGAHFGDNTRAGFLRAGTGAGPSSDPASRLKQLQAMRDSGLITNDEFESKRSEILDAI